MAGVYDIIKTKIPRDAFIQNWMDIFGVPAKVLTNNGLDFQKGGVRN